MYLWGWHGGARKDRILKIDCLKLAKNISTIFKRWPIPPKPAKAASLETRLQIKTLVSQRLSFQYQGHLKTPLSSPERKRTVGRGNLATVPRRRCCCPEEWGSAGSVQTVRLKTPPLVCRRSIHHSDFVIFYFLVFSLKSLTTPFTTPPPPPDSGKRQKMSAEFFWRFASYCCMKWVAHCDANKDSGADS